MKHGHTNRKAVAWARFQEAVAAQGGTVLEGAWLGSHTPHRVRCAMGHEVTPLPSNAKRQGICSICRFARCDNAWARFQEAVAAQGGTVLEGAWLGDSVPHRVRCRVGHEGAPHPNSINQGAGICRTCAGKSWDAFYVVRHPGADILKFGITSGDPRPRLKNHARNGFTEQVRVFAGLPGTDAPDLERELKSLLSHAGVQPVQGREYFTDATLNTVLTVVDDWLASTR